MSGNGASVHASAAMCGRLGILVRGASGAGKSWLAHELIELGERRFGYGRLIADDRVLLRQEGAALIACAPRTIRGLLEIRGTGIVRVPFVEQGGIGAIIDLGAPRMADALPYGVTLPRYECMDAEDALHWISTSFESNAPLREDIPLAHIAIGGKYTHPWQA